MRKKMMRLRQLVLDTAAETEGVDVLEETLKWGEPSYVTKGGSTVRMDWKGRAPDRYAMYFNCNTSLVDTSKELYGEVFAFEGNRAIVFSKADELPVGELKHCVSLALMYHRLEHLPLLGDLRIPPGNRLERLIGDRSGEHSIRINNQYRICFVWTDAGPAVVEITDYH